MRRHLIIAALFIPILLSANTAIAKITSLKGSADIIQGSVSRSAQLGSDLSVHDQITTHDNSKLQIIFQDETIVTIGKNSRFLVDEYVLDAEKSEVKLSLFKGAMRAVTGKIGKANPQKFKVKTKTATIGIRGTNLAIILGSENEEGQSGDDTYVCMQGGITVQGNGEEVDVPSGYMTRSNSNGDVQASVPFTAQQLDGILDGAFGVSETTEETDISADDTPSANTDDIGSDTNGEETVFIDSVPLESTSSSVQTSMTDAVSSLYAPIVGISGFASNISLPSFSYGSNGTVLYSVDTASKTFLEGSYLQTSFGMTLSLNTNPLSLSSAFDFETNFLPTSYSSNGYVYTVDTASANENYMRTVSDLDANDEITWGAWSVPIVEDYIEGVSTYTLKGNWIAGSQTPSSVIDGYRSGNMNARYTGSLIGTSFDSRDSTSTSFSGSVVSTVNFGAATVNTTLSYSVGSDAYVINLNNTIQANSSSFSGGSSTATLNGSPAGLSPDAGVGAFYGSDGKSIGGSFYMYESGSGYNRDMSGVYEAKTTQIQ